ncbi:hypothetical protein, partial [Yersinia similis]|uniref:hypothetical protein n=1 Tax=Yersinia similis TaxID=367190 RepID=UPI001E2CDE91
VRPHAQGSEERASANGGNDGEANPFQGCAPCQCLSRRKRTLSEAPAKGWHHKNPACRSSAAQRASESGPTGQ